MGAWGCGIRHDDFVCDVIGEFEDAMKSGKSAAGATAAVTSRFDAAIEDADDGPLFWIALADAQWTYGALEPAVLERVRDDFAAGRSVLAWQEISADWHSGELFSRSSSGNWRSRKPGQHGRRRSSGRRSFDQATV